MVWAPRGRGSSALDHLKMSYNVFVLLSFCSSPWTTSWRYWWWFAGSCNQQCSDSDSSNQCGISVSTQRCTRYVWLNCSHLCSPTERIGVLNAVGTTGAISEEPKSKWGCKYGVCRFNLFTYVSLLFVQCSRRRNTRMWKHQTGMFKMHLHSWISYSYIMAARVLSNLTTRARSARVR